MSKSSVSSRSMSRINDMDITTINSRTLNDICRALKHRRVEDGFSYRTRHAGRNDPIDPSTWNLPVYHCPVWFARFSMISYLTAFPRYRDVLSQFRINPESVLKIAL